MPTQQTGSAATAIFLKNNSPDQLRQAWDLWNKNSGLPGLLDANPSYAGESKTSQRTGYYYEVDKKIYRRADNGAVVTDKQLRTAVNKVSAAASLEMKKKTQQLIAGVILLSVWHESMQSLMGALYRTVWVLSIGGFVFEDDIQRNLFYLFVLSQFSWLDNFYYQLEHKLQALDGSAMNRAGMYGAYGNGLWQNIRLEYDIAAGKTEAKRILAPNENHCHDSADRRGCFELAQLGWIPIAQMVPITGATCYTLCLCEIITR